MAAVNVMRAPVLRKILTKYGVFRSKHHLANTEYVERILKLPETTITELGNGVRVASSQTNSPTSTVGLFVDSGIRNESRENNGVANFFEHLAFKGNREKSRQVLEKEIHDMGAQFYADTGREQTAFYAKCLSGDVPKAVEILGNAIQNTDFDDAQIETERKAILAELEEMQCGDLKPITFDYLHQVAYQGTELEKSVYGPTANIRNLKKSDIVDYVKQNFAGSRVVLAGSGDIKHDELVKLAEKHLGSLTNTMQSSTLPHCRYTGSDVRVRDDWLPFAHVAIAVDTCGADSPDVLPLALAKTIIGCWDKTMPSSHNTINKLVENIYKEKRCHSFEAFHTLYSDTGLWGCYFVMDGMILEDFVYNLQNEWMALCINIPESRLHIAKEQLRSELLHKRNDTTLDCIDIGQEVLNTGKRSPFITINRNLDFLPLNQFKEICSKYIYDRCPVVSAIGPVEALTDYTRIRGNMYWLRV